MSGGYTMIYKSIYKSTSKAVFVRYYKICNIVKLDTNLEHVYSRDGVRIKSKIIKYNESYFIYFTYVHQ